MLKVLRQFVQVKNKVNGLFIILGSHPGWYLHNKLSQDVRIDWGGKLIMFLYVSKVDWLACFQFLSDLMFCWSFEDEVVVLRLWRRVFFLLDFEHSTMSIITTIIEAIKFQALGLFSQPSSTRCSFQPLTPGLMSRWHRGHRLAAARGLAERHYFFSTWLL